MSEEIQLDAAVPADDRTVSAATEDQPALVPADEQIAPAPEKFQLKPVSTPLPPPEKAKEIGRAHV